MIADTPILEHVPTIGRFACHVEDCEESPEGGIYEPVPPLWLDYWPTCSCGARLKLENVYTKRG